MKVSEGKLDVEKSQRKYQVFISSTFRDLANQRRMVLDVVVDHGHMPISLERFPAEDSTVPLVIQRTIEASQIYVVILGYRYGAIVKDRGISFSHLEYEIAFDSKLVVVPFLLAEDEVKEYREKLVKELDDARTRVAKLAPKTLERENLQKQITELTAELHNEKKLWKFREIVQEGRFHKPFSLKKGGSVKQFDERMVLDALIEAERRAVVDRIPGWIREPKERESAGALEAVSRNRFLVSVVGAMAKFDPLDPRVRSEAEAKEAAASFFADKYLPPLLERHKALQEDKTLNKEDKTVSLFFESGSTVAYAAQVVGERLREQREEIRISTNNVLAYLVFWLVHRIRCSLFPWGPPEQLYGAVFDQVNDFVPLKKKPSFPPEPLSHTDQEAIRLLHDSYYSPSKWKRPALMLGALSGLQLKEDPQIANCLGPHVGSPRNKVFKRFMYDTKLPLMLMMTGNKINSDVDKERCHFILEQRVGQSLTWATFITERPVAFCVGCENVPEKINPAVAAFEALGLKIIRADHKTSHTAFLARNQKFIDELEQELNIR